MAEASKPTAQANTAIPHEGDHDRIQMASVNVDGTLDQHNPEFVGDKETAIAATKEQFKQQAVSAADVQDAALGGTTVEDAPQDPTIEARQKEHQKIEDAAEKAAEKVVNDLHKD